MSQRTAQIAAAIERVLSRAIPELSDPRLPIIVTIERVHITPDLLHAKVFISSLGEVTPVVEALNHAKGFLQRQIAHDIRLKRTPLLEFVAAGSFFDAP
jgi:ribosome-binding factor A